MVVKKLIFLSAIISLIAIRAFPQGDSRSNDIERLLMISDSIYGNNDELVNGAIYYQENLFAAGHPFFLSDDWFKGELRINGSVYNNVCLKYNIVSKRIILKANLHHVQVTPLVLNNNFVEKFSFGGHTFVNTVGELKDVSNADFLDLYYVGSFKFYAKHHKEFLKDYNTKTPYGKYSVISSKYYLVDENSIEKISSVKSLLNHFESHKKELKKYIKSVGFEYRKAGKEDWVKLLAYCDKLIIN